MEDAQEKHSPQPGLDSIEIEGATPAEAIKKALTMLGLTKKEVRVQILSEEKGGLFGMEGIQPAKVRVTRRFSSKK